MDYSNIPRVPEIKMIFMISTVQMSLLWLHVPAQGIATQGTLPNLTQIAAASGTTQTNIGAKPRSSNENIQPKGQLK